MKSELLKAAIEKKYFEKSIDIHPHLEYAGHVVDH